MVASVKLPLRTQGSGVLGLLKKLKDLYFGRQRTSVPRPILSSHQGFAPYALNPKSLLACPGTGGWGGGGRATHKCVSSEFEHDASQAI